MRISQGGNNMAIIQSSSDLRYEEDIWTYQDYLELPSDGKIYEIIGGKLFMTPAPTPKHQKISRNIEILMWDYVRKNKLGEVYYAPIDVTFDELNTVQPDLLYISRERSHIIKEKGIFGAPDLIVEILSPHSINTDVKRKKQIYERFAVKEYWIVDTDEKKVEIYIMQGGKYELKGIYLGQDIIESWQIEDLKISLEEIFE